MGRQLSAHIFVRAIAWVTAIFMVAVIVQWPTRAQAANIPVGGTCSLVNAILSANNNATVGTCVAGDDSNDTIVLTGTVQLTSPYTGDNGTPVITSTLTISGGVGGQIIERVSGSNFRILNVDAAGNLTLENITVRDGRILSLNGAGIYNDGGTLTLHNSAVVSNTVVTGGMGGGIYNNTGSTLTLTNSQLLSNTAQTGGALYHGGGTTTMSQSCIVANSRIAVANATGSALDATNNWWGATDGPSGVGTGAGDSVSTNVTFAPFLTTAPLGCPALTADVDFTKRIAPLGELLPGQPVTYTLVVTNTGLSDVNNLNLRDNLPAAFQVSEVISTGVAISATVTGYRIPHLDDGDVATLHLIGYVTSTLTSDLVLSNTATVSNAVAGLLTDNVTATVNVPILNWSSTIYSTTESSIPFTATITLSPTNPYTTVTALVAITDSILGTTFEPITFPAGTNSYALTIAANDDHLVMPRTVELELIADAGAALGNDGRATILYAENDVAEITVAKTPNTAAAEVGDKITYIYRITNTGNVTLTTITAADDVLGNIAGLSGTLAPTTTRMVTLTQVVQESDLPGPLVNTVTVTATDEVTTTLVVTDMASVAVSGTPDLVVSKTANVSTADVGDVIIYTYRITNTGNVTLQTIQATDDQLGAITGLAGTLAPSASRMTTRNYTVQESDLPSPLVNIVTVTGTDQFNVKATDSDSASVTLIGTRNLVITKHANVSTADVGDIIIYTYRITNTGKVTLQTIQATDDQLGAITGLAGTLAPNASRMTTRSYTVQESDLPGPLVNTVTTTGTDKLNVKATDSDSASVTLVGTRNLVITKHANVSTADVGDVIIYTYRITNTGNVTLQTIEATDNQVGAITGLAGTLAPNASRMTTRSYTVQESDLPGPLVNTVTTTGTDKLNVKATDSDSASVTLVGTRNLVGSKQANVSTANVGDTITYTYRITNTGKVTFQSIEAVDDQIGAITDLAGTLAPAASRTATRSYTVQESDLPGPLVNTITVTATDQFNVKTTDSVSTTVALAGTSALVVTKATNVSTTDVGDIITYTYRITNTGNVTMQSIEALDDLFGTITELAGSLAPTETRTATRAYTIQESDRPGPLANAIIVIGTDILDEPHIAYARASVILNPWGNRLPFVLGNLNVQDETQNGEQPAE